MLASRRFVLHLHEFAVLNCVLRCLTLLGFAWLCLTLVGPWLARFVELGLAFALLCVGFAFAQFCLAFA